MIKRGLSPRNGVVALLARLRETRLSVVRIGGAEEVFLVTADAICGSALEFPADVTRGALESSVRPGERESGHLQVIEARAEPRIHAGVALRASCGETGLLMVWRGSLQVV